MYKLCFYVPTDHLESVKQAVFAAGAGKIGNYDACCWQTRGQGQFRPLEGSRPLIGRRGEVATVEEYKVELVVADGCVGDVMAALKVSHPYEEPAYDIWRLEDI